MGVKYSNVFYINLVKGGGINRSGLAEGEMKMFC